MQIHVRLWVVLNYVIPGKLIDEEDGFSALIPDPRPLLLDPGWMKDPVLLGLA